MHKKPTTTSASHPTTDPDPPWIKPPSESTKNPLATHKTHCIKPKNKTQTADHLHRHTYTHHQQPKTGTPTNNPSPDLVKKKKETQICSCFNGFSVQEISGGLFAVRDRRWAVCCLRSAPERLLCEIGEGEGKWSCARKRERESRKGGRGERLQYFGKWFTDSVNCFPNFTQRFSGKQQTFYSWLWFYCETNTRKWWKHFTKNVLCRN